MTVSRDHPGIPTEVETDAAPQPPIPHTPASAYAARPPANPSSWEQPYQPSQLESSGDNIALQIELASSLPGLSSDPPVVPQGTQPSVAPVFQNGSIRVAVIGASLNRLGRNARLSLAIDNIFREPILLALQPDSSNQPMIILNDDQGRTWDTSAKDVSGVKVLIDCRRQGRIGR